MTALLPIAVRDLAARHGAGEEEAPAHVTFIQHGRMRQDQMARWMPFRARQSIGVKACRFDWRARLGPGGLVRVKDALGDDGGHLSARLLGLVPLARASGLEPTRGELMRYLAELPWCPDAMLHNRAIEWQALSGARLSACARMEGIEARVHFELGEDGRIASVSAPDRPRSVDGTFVDTPWWGHFFDYREQDGRCLPFQGVVGWEEDGRRFSVWEGRIERWQPIEVAY